MVKSALDHRRRSFNRVLMSVRVTRRMVAALVLAGAPALAPVVHAQDHAQDHADERAQGQDWSAGLALGYGSLGLTADQGRDERCGTFVLAFRASRALGPRLRLGAELGGWLIEAGDVWDPSRGASVSTAAILVQTFPLRTEPFYVEVQFGFAKYSNAAPLEFGSSGTGWSLGAGWEFRPSSVLRLSPSVSASGGVLRDIRNPVKTETGFRYSAWDLRFTTSYVLGDRERRP